MMGRLYSRMVYQTLIRSSVYGLGVLIFTVCCAVLENQVSSVIFARLTLTDTAALWLSAAVAALAISPLQHWIERRLAALIPSRSPAADRSAG